MCKESTANKLGVCINGTISGVLSQSKQGIYYIYNDAYKIQIECKIPDSLLEIADENLNEDCDISGIFYYRDGELYPYEIIVSDIENIIECYGRYDW